MAVYSVSTQRLTEIVLGSLDKGFEMAMLLSTTNATNWIYCKKLKSATLGTSRFGGGLKFFRYQDGDGTYAPTPKTGYKIIDLGLGNGISYDTGTNNHLYNTGLDARLLPHEGPIPFTITRLSGGSHTYRWFIVPTATPESKFKSWVLGKANNQNVKPLFAYRIPDISPVYQESYYKNRKFYDPNRWQ